MNLSNRPSSRPNSQRSRIREVLYNLKLPIAVAVGLGAAFMQEACHQPELQIRSLNNGEPTPEEQARRKLMDKQIQQVIEEERAQKKAAEAMMKELCENGGCSAG